MMALQHLLIPLASAASTWLQVIGTTHRGMHTLSLPASTLHRLPLFEDGGGVQDVVQLG